MRAPFGGALAEPSDAAPVVLRERARSVLSPAGKPIWGPSTIQGLLRNEAYICTVYCNRREAIEGSGRRG